MSDAFTDIVRDERRARSYYEYLETLYGYLTGVKTREDLIRQAQEVDSVPRGFWNGETNLAGNNNMVRAKKLLEEDRQAWILFLATLEGEVQNRFQEISPFAGQLLISVEHHYGSNFKVNSGNLKKFLESKTSEEIRHRPRLGYLLVLDPKALEGAEVQVFE